VREGAVFDGVIAGAVYFLGATLASQTGILAI
jgi:hypothetical protein